jgi:hypothetical protein
MDSHQSGNPLNVMGKTINRRSLLKGSATFAASTVACSTFGLINRGVQAEQSKSAALGTVNAWDDFPGGV